MPLGTYSPNFNTTKPIFDIFYIIFTFDVDFFT